MALLHRSGRFWEGFFCNQLGHLYGRHYMQINKPEHVIGKFNPHWRRSSSCAPTRRYSWGTHATATRSSASSRADGRIEPKNINSYSAPNYLNIDITTTHRTLCLRAAARAVSSCRPSARAGSATLNTSMQSRHSLRTADTKPSSITSV